MKYIPSTIAEELEFLNKLSKHIAELDRDRFPFFVWLGTTEEKDKPWNKKMRCNPIYKPKWFVEGYEKFKGLWEEIIRFQLCPDSLYHCWGRLENWDEKLRDMILEREEIICDDYGYCRSYTPHLSFQCLYGFFDENGGLESCLFGNDKFSVCKACHNEKKDCKIGVKPKKEKNEIKGPCGSLYCIECGFVDEIGDGFQQDLCDSCWDKIFDLYDDESEIDENGWVVDEFDKNFEFDDVIYIDFSKILEKEEVETKDE